jgi:hypothetical protein
MGDIFIIGAPLPPSFNLIFRPFYAIAIHVERVCAGSGDNKLSFGLKKKIAFRRQTCVLKKTSGGELGLRVGPKKNI